MINHLHLTGGERYWWCGKCGNRWEPKVRMVLQVHDEYVTDSAGSCRCHPDNYKVFPDQAAARSAFILGGLPAVHAIEQKLYEEQLSTQQLRDVVHWMFGVERNR